MTHIPLQLAPTRYGCAGARGPAGRSGAHAAEMGSPWRSVAVSTPGGWLVGAWWGERHAVEVREQPGEVTLEHENPWAGPAALLHQQLPATVPTPTATPYAALPTPA